MSRLLVLFLLALSPRAIHHPLPYNFIVFNVGQGAWSVFITPTHCLHFDIGGEKSPVKYAAKLCGRRKNHIYLTHLDWDHIRFLPFFSQKVAGACFYYKGKRSKRLPKELEVCRKKADEVQVLSFGNQNSSRNASSHVYLVDEKVLITGDAPMSEEKKWRYNLRSPLEILLLGHHGSATSTSLKLLRQFRPRQAISSARKKRYGHPHPKVIKKLKQQNIPLLRTERLGHIHFNL